MKLIIVEGATGNIPNPRQIKSWRQVGDGRIRRLECILDYGTVATSTSRIYLDENLSLQPVFTVSARTDPSHPMKPIYSGFDEKLAKQVEQDAINKGKTAFPDDRFTRFAQLEESRYRTLIDGTFSVGVGHDNNIYLTGKPDNTNRALVLLTHHNPGPSISKDKPAVIEWVTQPNILLLDEIIQIKTEGGLAAAMVIESGEEVVFKVRNRHQTEIIRYTWDGNRLDTYVYDEDLWLVFNRTTTPVIELV